MGWQDRDYASDYGTPRGGTFAPRIPAMGTIFRGRSMVTILIAINVVVYVLCVVSSGRSLIESPLFQWTALYAPAVMHGQVWRLLTATYLHWDGWHIFMNMIGLHFLGRSLERDWGPKRFLGVYTVAGILGNVFYIVLSQMGWLPTGIAAGASGSVLALLGAAAVRYPHATVYIYMLFPIKIRTAAAIFGGLYVLNLFKRGANAGGDACHLAGLLFGAWWAWRGDRWWTSSRRWGSNAGGIAQPQVRVRSWVTPRAKQRKEDQAAINAILKKVHEGGIHSLSESDKRILSEATERQRAQDAEFGRADRL